MDILYVIFLSVFSLVVLFLLTKLIGYRQMSEMSMFDYISGITIGSIAAEMATAPDSSFLEPLTAMIVYGLLTAFLAFITGKNMKIRHFISGSPYILFNDGHLYEGNFKKGHIDLSEFLVQCRLNGFFDLKELHRHGLEFLFSILEENGRISFLAKSEHRPVSPSDLNLSPHKERLLPTYIMDGKILYENLLHSGKDEEWLRKQLSAHGCKRLSDIFLATGNQQNTLNVYFKNNRRGSSVIKE